VYFNVSIVAHYWIYKVTLYSKRQWIYIVHESFTTSNQWIHRFSLLMYLFNLLHSHICLMSNDLCFHWFLLDLILQHWFQLVYSICDLFVSFYSMHIFRTCQIVFDWKKRKWWKVFCNFKWRQHEYQHYCIFFVINYKFKKCEIIGWL